MSDIGMPLVTVKVDDKLCNYCLDCVNACPSGALSYDKCFEHDPEECWNCEACMDVCETEALLINME